MGSRIIAKARRQQWLQKEKASHQDHSRSEQVESLHNSGELECLLDDNAGDEDAVPGESES